MELRQLRNFVAIAEELHFSRAAKRQHVVQSTLSQQLHSLESGLGVRLLDRDTHYVELTPAGQVLLVNARQILADVERAAAAVRRAARTTPVLRAGVPGGDHDCAWLVLDELSEQDPEFAVSRVRVGVAEQHAWLIDGRLDVGFGPSCPAPGAITSTLFHLDPIGVLVYAGHPFTTMTDVPVRSLAGTHIVIPEELRPLGFAQFVNQLCASAKVAVQLREGCPRSEAVMGGPATGGVVCAPKSYLPAPAGTVWRPLAGENTAFPWSVLSLSRNTSPHVQAVVACAEQRARRRGWLRDHSDDDPAQAGVMTC